MRTPVELVLEPRDTRNTSKRIWQHSKVKGNLIFQGVCWYLKYYKLNYVDVMPSKVINTAFCVAFES